MDSRLHQDIIYFCTLVIWYLYLFIDIIQNLVRYRKGRRCLCQSRETSRWGDLAIEANRVERRRTRNVRCYAKDLMTWNLEAKEEELSFNRHVSYVSGIHHCYWFPQNICETFIGIILYLKLRYKVFVVLISISCWRDKGKNHLGVNCNSVTSRNLL